MSFENPQNVDLVLSHKLETEKAVMKKMLGGNMDDANDLEWISLYAENVGNLIREDSARGAEIRELSFKERYDEAAERILKGLEEDGHIKKAA